MKYEILESNKNYSLVTFINKKETVRRWGVMGNNSQHPFHTSFSHDTSKLKFDEVSK